MSITDGREGSLASFQGKSAEVRFSPNRRHPAALPLPARWVAADASLPQFLRESPEDDQTERVEEAGLLSKVK
jgi:hypothetical protein